MATFLEEMKAELLARESEIVASIAELPIDLHQRDDHVGDTVDKSKAQVDQAQASALREREVTSLHLVRSALTRIEEGEYGECEGCGDDVPHGRLRANPFTKFCITCQEEIEHDLSTAPKTKRSFFDT